MNGLRNDHLSERFVGVFHVVLLMAEILQHLGCMKPYKRWDKLPIHWCRISAINRKFTIFLTYLGPILTPVLIGVKGPSALEVFLAPKVEDKQVPGIYCPTQKLELV